MVLPKPVEQVSSSGACSAADATRAMQHGREADRTMMLPKPVASAPTRRAKDRTGGALTSTSTYLDVDRGH